MKHKKLFAILTLVCFLFTLMPVAAMAEEPMNFTDVSPSDWYYNVVKYAYENGLMGGTSETTFDPDATLSRGTLMTVLHRMEGSPAAIGEGFKDVADGEWYADAIVWAKSVGLAAGLTADTFGPNETLTREQLAVFMWRYAQWKGIDVSVGENTNILSYEDAFTISDWAYSALQWACGVGLLGGVGDGYLDPQGTATRAQLAAIMQRFETNVASKAEDDKKEEEKKPSYSGGGGSSSGGSSTPALPDTPEVPDTPDVPDTPEDIAVDAVTLDNTTMTLTAGDTVTLVATVTPDNAKDKTVTWSSSNEAVATVNDSGVVTAVAEGTATITAKAGEKTATCVVTVNAATVPVTGVTLNMTTATLTTTTGNSITLVATVTPDDATKKAVRWSSSNEAVAIVDGNGEVTGVTTGSAIITVTTVDGGKTATCAVTVTEIPVAVTDISLNKNEVRVVVGETETLEATVTPSNATYGTIEWTSSNVAIVTVDNGTLTGVADGTATVTAKAGTVTTACAVTVHAHDYIAGYEQNDDGTHRKLCGCGAKAELEDCKYDTIKDVNGLNFEACVCGNTTGRIIVDNDASLKAALESDLENIEIVLKGGQYGIVDVTVNRTRTLVAADGEDVKIAGIDGQNNSINNTTNITFKGVTMDNSLQTAGWYTGTSPNIKPCVGVWGGDYTFEDCTFNVTGASGAETGVMSWWTIGKGTMNFKGCTFNGGNTSARAMQIYGNYDLNVEGCTFNTAKDYSIKYVGKEGTKATFKGNTVDKTVNFVQTGSAPYAGANYALEFVGNTLAEGINHVYVDNDENQTITINGVAYVYSNDDLSDALTNANDGNVVLEKGEYNLPGVSDKNVTISGTEDTVITVNKPAYHGSSVTLNGVTVKGSGYSTGIQHVNTVTYKDATIVGEMCLYGEKVVFDHCTFELAADQYIWTYGAEEVEFNNCTFNTAGKALLIYNEGANADSKVTVTGCTFKATAGAKAGAIANQNCAAIEIDSTHGDSFTLTTSGNTIVGDFSGEWRIKACNEKVIVNGAEYTTIALNGKTMTIDADKNVTVNE